MNARPVAVGVSILLLCAALGDCLADEPAPIARANTASPERPASMAADGDKSDAKSWCGKGCPNWLEIELPHAVDLARVIVHPGDLRCWKNPSTECSPREFIVEGWIDGEWQPLSPAVHVPRYKGGEGAHRVVVDVPPKRVRKFRVNITALYDEGKRLRSPDKPVVPAAERSAVIREIEWQTGRQIAETKCRVTEGRKALTDAIRSWRAVFGQPSAVGRALRTRYVEFVKQIEGELTALSDEDIPGLDELTQRWRRMEKWLAPWRSCVSGNAATPGAAGEMEIEVDPGDTPHEFYPASVPFDLAVAERAMGRPVDPYTIQVLDRGKPCPTRFDRITPKRGMLTWTMRDRTHTRFTVRLLPRKDGPPPADGHCTLGNCDKFYFAQSGDQYLPGNLWSAAFVDWDGDGRKDLIAGRWTDYCHFWRNVGDTGKMEFSEREHWHVIDSTDTPLLAKPDHPGLGFSMAYPVDFDGDGRLDVFFTNYYGTPPRFYRNLGPKSFPIVAPGRKPINLSHGKIAFGDLNGDGIPDALVVRRLSERDRLVLHKGRGLSPDGRPIFAGKEKLGVPVQRSAVGHCKTCPALADIDADGDLDLFLYAAPVLWQYENVGTAKAHKFAAPTKVMRKDQPINLGYYYPYIAWFDVDSDGDLDLVKCTGLSVYLNEGDAERLKLGKLWRPKVSAQKAVGRAGLKAFDLVDWDGDGDLDRVRAWARGTELTVDEFQDGLFRRSFRVDVDANKLDWYGCPDTTEYFALYANVKLLDWDSDGDLDLFITSEHSWRFGYIHYYENRGDYKFAPEVRLRPLATCDHVRFADGKSGKAAVVDEKAFVDFLSYPTQGAFDAAGGTIRFWFRPEWNADDGKTHTLFYTIQNPCTYGVKSRDLHLHYVGLKPDLKLRPPFALVKTKGGTLRLQTWGQAVETKPLDWKSGEWHKVEATWGPKGRRLSIDGATAAADPSPVKTAPVGGRIFIGCNSVMLVQREREYPGRWKAHPVERVFPAAGAFDDFEIQDRHGKALLTLPFDGNCDTAQGVSGGRMKIGYRCTPGFADMNGDGLLDMVMMVGDGRRGRGSKPEQQTWGQGRLYLFPNVGTKTKPRLGEAVLVRHKNGTPFACHIRTQINGIDWDRDGRTDLILSTENYGQAKSNRAVDLYRNVGTREKPVFGARRPMEGLNTRIQPWHDVKLVATDLTGNGREDIVTSTDPGTRVCYRSFLDEEPVAVRFLRITPAKGKPEP